MKGLRIESNSGVVKHIIKTSLLFFIILAISNPMFLFVNSQSANPKCIFILNSYHKGLLWSDNIVNGIETTFDSSDEYIELTIEYMDSKNNLYNETYKQMLYDFYSYKYAQVSFDVVIATDDNALNFLLDYHDDLFPSIPVVFCGINNLDVPSLVNRSLYTGMLEIIGYSDTIELMLDLHPETNNIITIMCDTPTGNYAWEQFTSIIPLFSELSITRVNTSYSTEEVKSFIGNQDEDTLFLFYSWYRDGNGTYYTLKEGTEIISEACSRPLYGLHAQALSYGIVGGKLLSGTYHGISIANMTLRILAGENPSEIEIIDEIYAEYMFNYDQLKRWGIELSDLPQDCVIVNSPFSFYKEYSLLIWLVIGIVFLLVVVIFTLVLTITKRKQVENELVKYQTQLELLVENRSKQYMESEECLHDFINSSTEIFLRLDSKLNFILVNEMGLKFYGLTQKEIINRNVTEIVPGIDETQRYKDYLSVIQTGNPIVFDVNATISNNEVILNIRAFKVGEGLGLIIRDITEKRLMEEKIARQEKLSILGRLVGGIGHELRNPLGSIKNAAYFLRMAIDDPDPEVKETLSILENEVDVSEGIIKNLLDLTRTKPLVKMKVNINEIIKTALARIKVPNNIEVDIRLSTKLPIIYADPNQLTQVFINIITNGIQAIEKEGKIIVKTSKKDSESIVIEISDTGIGMSKEVQKTLFEPLYTTKAKGIGLGMVITKTILEKHNGTIDVTSEEGKGCTVTIDLPIGLSVEGQFNGKHNHLDSR